MSEELLPGVVKQLQDAIWPLINPQPHWNAGQPGLADPLYHRMRQALTATSLRTGATTQKSKPPARIDVLDWLRDIDHSTATWDDNPTTPDRLNAIHETTWTPDHINILKLMTRRCERWTHIAKELLGDNPITVPLRGERCPKCEALKAYRRKDGEVVGVPALMLGEHGAQCLACRTRWITEAEQASFRKMLNL